MNVEVKITFNKDWRKPILTNGKVRDVVWTTTSRLQNEANANAGGGNNFGKWVKMGYMWSGRWVGFVYAKNETAQAAQSENQALTRTLHT